MAKTARAPTKSEILNHIAKDTDLSRKQISGVLDSQGHARHEGVPNKALRVEYEPRTPENDASWDKLDKLVSATAARLSK